MIIWLPFFNMYHTFLFSSQSCLLYELFSVMVHSGSAAGGHYYACIKSFSDDQWYSFNDQHVSKVKIVLLVICVLIDEPVSFWFSMLFFTYI